MTEFGKMVLAVVLAQVIIIGALSAKELLTPKGVSREEIAAAFSQRDKLISKIVGKVDDLQSAKNKK